MEKDEYAILQYRKDIALALISRPDFDIQLLPALDLYVKNGDISAFTSFAKFRKSLSIKEQEDRFNKDVKEWQEKKPEIERWMNDFDGVVKEWQEWVEKNGGEAIFESKNKKTRIRKELKFTPANPFEYYLGNYEIDVFGNRTFFQPIRPELIF